jgi:hypothetical protein
LNGYKGSNVFHSDVSLAISVHIFDGQVNVSQVPMLPLLIHFLLPMNLCCFVSINQAVNELIMRLANRQEGVNLFFSWEEDLLDNVNRITKPQIAEFLVEPFPLGVATVVFISIEGFLNSTEHVFGVSEIIVHLYLFHEGVYEFMKLFGLLFWKLKEISVNRKNVICFAKGDFDAVEIW